MKRAYVLCSTDQLLEGELKYLEKLFHEKVFHEKNNDRNAAIKQKNAINTTVDG